MHWALVGILTLAFAADANAALLCAKRKTGIIAVRELGCRGNEVQIDPLALGLKGEKGDPGPQGMAGATGEKGAKGDPGPAGLPAATSIDCEMIRVQPGCPGAHLVATQFAP